MKVRFVKDKDTKNTVRYTEIEENGWAKVGTLYIQKAAVAQENLGDKIVVEVKPEQ